jgi:hypothetical protein
MIAVVEHNMQDVIMVYCKVFAKVENVFQIQVITGIEFYFTVEGCTRILTSRRIR